MGRSVNARYRRITTAIGLETSRRTQVNATATLGNRYLTFTGVEKLINVIDRSSGRDIVLTQLTMDEMRLLNTRSAPPRHYAIHRNYETSVEIYMDVVPEAPLFTLYADAHTTVSTLSQNDSPDIPESFHDVIVIGVLADEYRKMEKYQFYKDASKEYEDRLSDLRMWIAKTGYLDIYQAKLADGVARSSTGGGGGSSGSSAPHALLDGVTNVDTLAGVPTRGALIKGNITPLWEAFPLGSTGTFLKCDGTDLVWGFINFADISGTISFDDLTGLGAAGLYLQSNGTSTQWSIPALTDLTGDLALSQLAQGSGLSVLGVTGSAGADHASIVAAADYQVLRRSGFNVDFGAIAINQSAAVTGELAVVHGGTGNSTLQSGGVLIGAGAGPITSLLPLNVPTGGTGTTGFTAGAVLVGNGTSAVTEQLPLSVASGGTGAVTLSSAGVLVGNGTSNIQVSQVPSLNGIQFPGTQVPSGDAHCLDDYEEGTWTPELGGTVSTSGQAYSTQSGTYVKIGAVVVAKAYVQFSAKGTITGALVVNGLPFASGGGSSFYAATVGYMSNLAVGTKSPKTCVMAFQQAGQTFINMFSVNDFTAGGGNPLAMDGTDVNDTTQLIINLTYTVV